MEPHHRVVTLRSGEKLLLRPLTGEDAEPLGNYFLGLSPETRRLYGPHAFDQKTADHLCGAVGRDNTIRMIAIKADHQIIGYFILQLGVRDSDRKRYAGYGIELADDTDCLLAPSIADDYQTQGLGSLMLLHCFEVMKQCGRRRMILMGGVREENTRARNFYTKFGFEAIGEFDARDCHNIDMLAALD